MSDNSSLPARVFQINLSGGGVPKLPVRSAEVTYLGLRGDDHNDKVHHGGPEKALALYSLELIQALQAEGHPIYPGSTGENITLAGLDWSRVVAGLRLRLGETVEIEITRYASPCETIRESFRDGYFNRISWRTNPGWARAYARVLTPGIVRIGDAALVADQVVVDQVVAP
jgi:MOSC domain-containing protein YiiM